MADLKEFELRRDRLKECRTTGNAQQDPKEVLLILKELAGMRMDTGILQATGIGKEVNDPFFRKHADPEVRDSSSNLVKMWKDIALGKSQPAGPSAAVAAAAPVASPEKKEKRPAPDSEKKPAKAAKSQKKTVNRSGPNEELAALFQELASFEFKKGGTSKFAGMAFNKVAATLRGLEEKVTAGKSVASLPGIGKESVKKIDQYLETGQIEKLEKYRNGEE